MVYWFAILAGVVQGLTEFLPISSSGHLVLLHELAVSLPGSLTFDVALHLGTAAAVVAYFWADLRRLLAAFFASLRRPRLATDLDQRLAWYIAVGTVPAGLVGYFLEDQIVAYFRNPTSVAAMLIAFGALLWIADAAAARSDDLRKLTWGRALLIGVAQALALVPGVSRSGVTIIAGLSARLDRASAARYSFLLSVPAVLGAGAKKLADAASSGIAPDVVTTLLGAAAAAVVGWLTIRYFLAFLQRGSLRWFALYRVALGLAILALV